MSEPTLALWLNDVTSQVVAGLILLLLGRWLNKL